MVVVSSSIKLWRLPNNPLVFTNACHHSWFTVNTLSDFSKVAITTHPMVGKVAVTNHPAISALTLLRQVHAVVCFSSLRRVEAERGRECTM